MTTRRRRGLARLRLGRVRFGVGKTIVGAEHALLAGVKVATQTPPIRTGRRVIFLTLDDSTDTTPDETTPPDITANGRASFEQLVSNVFDPSLVIGPAYQVTTVVTKDGRNLTGLIAEDNEQRIVIRMPGEGEETIPRNNVKYTRVSKLSMMPEGIEALLGRQELSDLFAFLSLDKPPEDPAADDTEDPCQVDEGETALLPTT